MIKKYITYKNGVVTNIILVDTDKEPIEKINLGSGVEYLEWDITKHRMVCEGDSYDKKTDTFTHVEPTEPTVQEITKEELLAQLQELTAKIEALPD